METGKLNEGTIARLEAALQELEAQRTVALRDFDARREALSSALEIIRGLDDEGSNG